MSSQEEMGTVEVPTRVIERVDERLPRTEFDSTGEYVTSVMEEVLTYVEEETSEEFESADEDEVKSRLQSLGYLDE